MALTKANEKTDICEINTVKINIFQSIAVLTVAVVMANPEWYCAKHCIPQVIEK